jgi:GNAT superfamily N-acetyltransferase
VTGAGAAAPRSGRTRLARAEDLTDLRRIELAAGALFATVGMDDVAGDEPASLEVLAGYQGDGRAWVSVGDDDRPVGYALAFELDGAGHLEQLSVDPAAGRQGRGRELVEVVAAWARGRGLAGVTLSTFLDVAWNAPYYRTLGFGVLAEHELTPGLVTLRRARRRTVWTPPGAPSCAATADARRQLPRLHMVSRSWRL